MSDDPKLKELPPAETIVVTFNNQKFLVPRRGTPVLNCWISSGNGLFSLVLIEGLMEGGARCAAHAMLGPVMLKQLRNLIDGEIQKYEAKHGEIQVSPQVDTPRILN